MENARRSGHCLFTGSTTVSTSVRRLLNFGDKSFTWIMLPPDPIYIFKGEMDSILCISSKITPHVEYIYAGTKCGKVHIWDLKTKRQLGHFKSGNDSCLSIKIPNEEEDLVITQNKMGEISFWKEKNSQWTMLNRIITDFFGFCKSLIFQDILYTSLKDCRCQLISVKTRAAIEIIDFSDGRKLGDIMAIKVAILANATCIFIAYEGHQLTLWDLKSKKKISDLPLAECPMAIDFHENSYKGICGHPTNELLIFSLNKNLELKTEKAISLINAGVASVRIRPDGKLVAVGCWDGKLKLYSWKNLILLAVLDTHSLTVEDICFITKNSKKDKNKFLIAAGSKDTKISLWDIYNSSKCGCYTFGEEEVFFL